MAEAATRQPVHGLLTVVRPATDDDVELLVGWHADPEVSRFWDDEIYTAEEIRADYADPLVDHWIVEAAGEPVGFVQSWWEAEGGSRRDETAAPRRGGLDGFLVPGARGRGLMPDAARALSRSLLAAGWQYVTVDPYVWNEQGLRGWSNAGFVEVSRHDADKDHTAPWVLMRFEDS
jgi:aminoglycoside 6'-N-acetyltransferase